MPDIHLSIRPDSIAVLTFDQSGSKANVLNANLWAEFETALESLATRTELSGLILASAKPGIFIAGADLNLLMNATGPNDTTVRSFLATGLRVLEKLESLPFPTIAAIDGAALGGGLEVALACDYRLGNAANPRLRLGLPEVTLGLIPGWGGTQRLPRLIGAPAAIEMVVSGQFLDYQSCLSNGLLNVAFNEPGDVLEASIAYLRKKPAFAGVRSKKRSPMSVPESRPDARGDSAAAIAARRVIQEGSQLSLVEGLAIETEAFMLLAGSEDSKRLIAAFFASRKKT